MSAKKDRNKAEEPDVFYEKPLSFDDVWKMFKETSQQMRETDKKIKELSALFTSQWGKLVESLVEGDLVHLLNEWGIPVERTNQRVKGNYQGESYEFDIIAENSKEIVVVEVKTTLRPSDIKNFLKKLDKLKNWIPRYSENIVYGAVAFLTEDSGCSKMAEGKGLFVIKATGNSSSIINKKDFKPKVY
ncbi:MAG: hypothetical protein K9I94_00735 [Bacteroidales bacterium]|nr:hypothetical protein [Bacteroidales bacterium]